MWLEEKGRDVGHALKIVPSALVSWRFSGHIMTFIVLGLWPRLYPLSGMLVLSS